MEPPQEQRDDLVRVSNQIEYVSAILRDELKHGGIISPGEVKKAADNAEEALERLLEIQKALR